VRSGSKFLASLSPLLLVVAFLAAPLPRARGEDRVAEAGKHAAKAEWEQAQALYAEALKADPARPAAFFYNYGTVALRNNQAGAASVLLLKSLRLNPFDGDARANLRQARGKMGPQALAVRPASWLSWWPDDARAFPVSLWWILGLAFLTPFLLVSVRRQNPGWRWPALLAASFFLAGGACAAWDQRYQQGGLLAVAKILSGPAPTFPEIGNLDAGALLSLEEEREGWYKIRYLNPAMQEVVGWVESPAVLSLSR
jgi:tetratricopeptide (TPR) repeat protein